MYKQPVSIKDLGKKRKLPEQPTLEALKRFKHDDPSRDRATIEDVGEDDDAFAAAGPSRSDAFDDVEDEEGGRMYGGGISDAQKKVYVLDGNVPILVNRTTMDETLDMEAKSHVEMFHHYKMLMHI